MSEERIEIVKKEIKLEWMNREYLAFVLENVYTPAECEEFIRIAEETGFEEAMVNVGGGKQELMKDYRNSDRCIIDSFGLSGEFFERIKTFLPSNYKGSDIVSLNERLRILKYGKGQYFAPHMDGVYLRDDKSEVSKITVQLYLNQSFEGGETTFLGGANEKEAVIPKIGSVLVFEHRLLHEGSILLSGIKYAIRTDVMYTYHSPY